MNIKTFSLIMALIFVVSACKRPDSGEKTKQKIETPAMQVSEPVTSGKSEGGAQGMQPDTAQNVPDGSPAAVPPVNITTAPATPVVLKSASNVEIIVDGSGSMNGLLGQVAKIDSLKTVLKNIVSTPYPSEMVKRKVALRVFGNKSTSDKEDCSDTTLDVNMGTLDTETFNRAVDAIMPKGISPLAFVLESAGMDFKEPAETTDNRIILIADGEDTCSGDVVAAAERLHRGRSAVMVDVVGFDVDQTAQSILQKVAEATDGHFFLARSDAELMSAIDQSLNASLPYNLRIKITSGGVTAIPSTVTIYRANTQSIVERADIVGMKFLKLPAGTYDILAEYNASVEVAKPSRMIKGVEVQTTMKAEQVVQFDLGGLNLVAIDQDDKEVSANFYFRRVDSEEIVAQLMEAQTPRIVFLTPGVYDIDTETTSAETATLTAQVKGVTVKAGETIEQRLKFLTGKISLKGQTIDKQQVPVSYRVTKPDSSDVIIHGTGSLTDSIIDLAPGNYDVYVTWTDPKMLGAAEVKLEDVSVKGGETLEQMVTFTTGALKISGKNNEGKYVYTEFSLKRAGETEEMAKIAVEDGVKEVFVSPGKYDITATDTTSKVVPPPSIMWTDVVVEEGKTREYEAVFQLGTIKLLGKNAKEQLIRTSYSVFRSGIDEPIVTESADHAWVVFNLTPGFYDVMAEDAGARSDPKPAVWFHDVEIKAGATVTQEAVFTSGKLKLLCRGKNNVVLTCEFNIFSYGSDTALYSGITSGEWKEFEILPGKYYMEAGWHDPVEEQLLKKWINIVIGENQILEEILRF